MNFIFFDDPARFDASADQLAEALQTDIGWIRQHTEYGEAARRWSAAGRPRGLLLHSPTLEVAEHWIVSQPRGAPDPTEEIRTFVAASRHGARSAQRLRRIVQTSIVALLVVIIIGLVGWINQSYIAAQWRWVTIGRPFMIRNVRPYVLSAAAEQTLKIKDTFHECASSPDKHYCPEIVVIPRGSFMMGSPPIETGHHANESPQHNVTIAKPFAVSKFELTFEEWDTCVANGDCADARDMRWGRGEQPVINVSWEDAQRYVAWLSKVTGKPYRLLTEAEYEYAARAGTQTAYPWGDDIGKNNANCATCDSEWDWKRTAPVGSFAPNSFGLYDMVGNVWEWTDDCYHDNYESAPADGSAWSVAAAAAASFAVGRITALPSTFAPQPATISPPTLGSTFSVSELAGHWTSERSTLMEVAHMKFPAPSFFLAILVILSTPLVARSQIVAIGDSNVAGKGVSSSENYPAKLERELRAKGYTGIVVINAGINGDTTQGVLRRLNTDVPPSTKVAIVWVGINDVMKQGIPRETVAANKTEIANRLRARGIEVVTFTPSCQACAKIRNTS